MKTSTNRFALSKMQYQLPLPQKISLRNSTLSALLIAFLLITLYGCGKPSNIPNPTPVNPTGCAIATDIDQALGVRQFEYDDKGLLVKMTGPNYYYGPFVRTISSTKVVDAYPSATVDGNGNHFYGNINITYVYPGGSGNIYDGNPGFMSECLPLLTHLIRIKEIQRINLYMTMRRNILPQFY